MPSDRIKEGNNTGPDNTDLSSSLHSIAQNELALLFFKQLLRIKDGLDNACDVMLLVPS